jgi:transcriptional regulator with GAF, ATPase, and Fis domain
LTLAGVEDLWAAELLGLKSSTLVSRMKSLGIEQPQ